MFDPVFDPLEDVPTSCCLSSATRRKEGDAGQSDPPAGPRSGPLRGAEEGVALARSRIAPAGSGGKETPPGSRSQRDERARLRAPEGENTSVE
jgi:hypothetical protein